MGAQVSGLVFGPTQVILNQGNVAATSGTVDGMSAMEKLEKLMRKLQGEFMSADGKTVDYENMRKSPTFAEYCTFACTLSAIDLSSIHEVQRKAFFINLYNLVTIHALAVLQSTEKERLTSPFKVKNFWNTMAYSVAGMTFSLDDIEHGILRANRPHPMKALFSKTYFKETDRRALFTLEHLDPRIHFALNCGALSCPRISVFSGKDEKMLSSSLDVAAEAFVAENVTVDAEQNKIRLSKIFDWYGTDFGDTMESRLVVISKWMPNDRKEAFMVLVNNHPKVTFAPYNWDLNEK